MSEKPIEVERISDNVVLITTEEDQVVLSATGKRMNISINAGKDQRLSNLE